MKHTSFALVFFVTGLIIFLSTSIIATWLWEYETYRQALQTHTVSLPCAFLSFIGSLLFTTFVEMDRNDKRKEEEERAKRAYWQRYYNSIYR